MERFTIRFDKGEETYTEENGKYYVQGKVWWEKGGYYVPQTKKRISKKSYFAMKKIAEKEEEA